MYFGCECKEGVCGVGGEVDEVVRKVNMTFVVWLSLYMRRSWKRLFISLVLGLDV